ncbi:MAG: hypothetical protein WCY78_06250 [Sphaerochaetaceae bacterium]
MKPTLVVMAAGFGSRYGGIKQIDAIGLDNEALLDYATYDALHNGFGKIVFVIRKDIEKDFRERVFDRIAANCDATYVFQELDSLLSAQQIEASQGRTKPWGTVHALLCAKGEIDRPFSIINSDDYYGREPFALMGQHLSALDNSSVEHANVGFILRNTTSLNGSVSRAICEVEEGYLVSMQEHKEIYHKGTAIYSKVDAKEILLTGDEYVSMNFFGFAPTAIDFYEEYFQEFLKTAVTSEKEESYLPEGANLIVKRGLGRMRFYTTGEQWFGMTYQEDRDLVKQKIKEKVEQGIYPKKLWSH